MQNLLIIFHKPSKYAKIFAYQVPTSQYSRVLSTKRHLIASLFCAITAMHPQSRPNTAHSRLGNRARIFAAARGSVRKLRNPFLRQITRSDDHWADKGERLEMIKYSTAYNGQFVPGAKTPRPLLLRGKLGGRDREGETKQCRSRLISIICCRYITWATFVFRLLFAWFKSATESAKCNWACFGEARRRVISAMESSLARVEYAENI